MEGTLNALEGNEKRPRAHTVCSLEVFSEVDYAVATPLLHGAKHHLGHIGSKPSNGLLTSACHTHKQGTSPAGHIEWCLRHQVNKEQQLALQYTEESDHKGCRTVIAYGIVKHSSLDLLRPAKSEDTVILR
jgi:hypothetical protein